MYVGSSAGLLAQIVISSKDVKLARTKRVSNERIKQIICNIPSSSNKFFVLTKTTVMGLDRTDFNLHSIYELD